jgi:hypothetical protein
MNKENDNYRVLDENDRVDRLTEAWIMWAKTALELSDIIDTLYKQYKVLDDPEMMRQVIEMAYQAKQERLDPVAVKKMKDFIRENILIEKGE